MSWFYETKFPGRGIVECPQENNNRLGKIEPNLNLQALQQNHGCFLLKEHFRVSRLYAQPFVRGGTIVLRNLVQKAEPLLEDCTR